MAKKPASKARARTPAQRAAEKTYEKKREGKLVSARLTEAEAALLDVRRGKRSVNAYVGDLIRAHLGVNRKSGEG
jgi:hypothetical protein